MIFSLEFYQQYAVESRHFEYDRLIDTYINELPDESFVIVDIPELKEHHIETILSRLEAGNECYVDFCWSYYQRDWCKPEHKRRIAASFIKIDAESSTPMSYMLISLGIATEERAYDHLLESIGMTHSVIKHYPLRIEQIRQIIKHYVESSMCTVPGVSSLIIPELISKYKLNREVMVMLLESMKKVECETGVFYILRRKVESILQYV